MRAYEKACPLCWVTASPRCEFCHGTGVVPMITSEILDALADRAKTSTCGVYYDPILNLWFAWSDSQKAHARKDCDDALRAALEAVSGS